MAYEQDVRPLDKNVSGRLDASRSPRIPSHRDGRADDHPLHVEHPGPDVCRAGGVRGAVGLYRFQGEQKADRGPGPPASAASKQVNPKSRDTGPGFGKSKVWGLTPLKLSDRLLGLNDYPGSLIQQESKQVKY